MVVTIEQQNRKLNRIRNVKAFDYSFYEKKVVIYYHNSETCDVHYDVEAIFEVRTTYSDTSVDYRDPTDNYCYEG